MSDQQSDTETVGKSATQLQQQEEGSIASPIETDPSGTDQGDATKSPTIAEKEKSKGVAPATPNTSSVDDAARSEDRSTLTLNPDGQGPKSIVTINLDGNEDDAPMDSPAEPMDATIARLAANHKELTSSLSNDTSGDKDGQELPSNESPSETTEPKEKPPLDFGSGLARICLDAKEHEERAIDRSDPIGIEPFALRQEEEDRRQKKKAAREAERKAFSELPKEEQQRILKAKAARDLALKIRMESSLDNLNESYARSRNNLQLEAANRRGRVLRSGRGVHDLEPESTSGGRPTDHHPPVHKEEANRRHHLLLVVLMRL